MKVWVTKYALSSGVRVGDGKAHAGITGTEYVMMNGHNLLRLGRDAHATEAGALKRVAEMVKAKQRSIARQQAALAKIADGIEAGRLPMEKSK